MAPSKNVFSSTLTIDSHRRAALVDKRLYSGFIEHMGRGIYGGVYEKNSSLSDESGFRLDVLEVIRDELKTPLVRYPGGNFTATYHWEDGVGPRENRPGRPNLAWGGIESNDFGTDEFLAWCQQADTEPCLCVNMGTGTLDEAMAWLEYCNSSESGYYASLRRKHGRQEPYNVKTWELGNETYGWWQVAQSTAEEYTAKAVQWARALKKIDSSIEVILCCENGIGSWERIVIDGAAHEVEYVSIHNFTFSDDPLINSTAPLVAEHGINITKSLIDLAFVEHNDRLSTPSRQRPRICFNEWNVWDMQRWPGDIGSEQVYTLSDALGVASWLNVFVRNAEAVAIASPAQTVNAISPLHVHPKGILKHTTYHVLKLFSKYMQGQLLDVHLATDGYYTGPTLPTWIQHSQKIPLIDVSATIDDATGSINAAILNRSLDDQSLNLRVLDIVEDYEPFERHEVAADCIMAKNTLESPQNVMPVNLGPFSTPLVTLPKHSFTLLRWKSKDV